MGKKKQKTATDKLEVVPDISLDDFEAAGLGPNRPLIPHVQQIRLNDPETYRLLVKAWTERGWRGSVCARFLKVRGYRNVTAAMITSYFREGKHLSDAKQRT